MLFIPALLAVAAAVALHDSVPKIVAPKTLPELEARIRRVLDSARVPGVGLAIVRHDSNDPLTKRLPGFYFRNPWEATDPVRIVHLLEHTAGFDDNSLKSYANSDPAPLALEAGLALDSATRVSRWRPGTRFSYCNTGPAIVARIIELIEGKPFEQVVQERWFTPVGMRTATYFRPDSTRLAVATLYRADGTTPFPYWQVFIRPAGSINATAHDMAAYVRFLLARGTIDGKTLLPAEALDRMERSESSLATRAGLLLGYGLNMYRTTDSTGFIWTSHNGGVQGGLSDLSYMPAFGVGYALQINSANAGAFRMETRLVRAYITQGLTPPPAPARSTTSPLAFARFGGWYRSVSPRQEHLRFLERIATLSRVHISDSALVLAPALGQAIAFVPVDSLHFRTNGEAAATLALVSDEVNDRPQGIEMSGSGLGQSWERVSTTQALLNIALAALWLTGIALTLVAALFVGARWVVQRVRKRPTPSAAAALPWRWAFGAMATVVVAITLASVGGDDLAALGNLSVISGGIWIAGLAFALLALFGVVVARRRAIVRTTWERVSLGAARAVIVLNAVAACYLAYWGLIGWRLWA